jgi:vacuolar-type H+-ATPase subunit H
VTPAQILEQLQNRVAELERELADAEAAVHDNRRLQDLSPDELSLVAVGAAGDIIKAAQTQAAEIRREVEENQRHSSEKIQAALARAQDRATELVTDAETASAETTSKAQAASEEILERVRTEAGAMTASAQVEAERIRDEARRISDALVLEAQTRLEVALRSADEAVSAANDEGRQIVEAARSMADSLRDDARSEARGSLRTSLDEIRVQENDMTSLLHETSSMRKAIDGALQTILTAMDTAAAESARVEASNRSFLASMTQMRSELERRLGPPSQAS